MRLEMKSRWVLSRNEVLRWGVKFFSFCCYVQGSLYTMWNFRTLTAKFYYENEGWKSAEGSDIQIYYIWPITPVLWSCDPCDMSEMLFRHNSDVIPMLHLCNLTCWHASNFWGATQCRVAVVTGLDCMCNIGKSEIHQKWLEMIGNDWKVPGRVGLGQVTSVICGAIMWSSTSAAKMRKYVDSKLWCSSVWPQWGWRQLQNHLWGSELHVYRLWSFFVLKTVHSTGSYYTKSDWRCQSSEML